MRLAEEDARMIARCAAEAFGSAAVVRLFGSRVDDSRRGGDIDLHVEIPDRPDWLQAKHRFQVALLKTLGDRRIDVVLHRSGQPMRPIDEIAHRDGVVL